MGARPDREPQLAALRLARPPATPGVWSRASSPASAATATASACPRSAARSVRRPLRRQHPRQRLHRAASPATDRIFYGRATGVGQPDPLLGAKTGRDGIHGATMASAAFEADAEAEAADGAGRRSLHGEAAARGLPRALRLGRGRGHPGHGRGGAHLVGGRDGGQGQPRRRARPRRRALPRDRHERLRDDALREPGAHADGAEARARSRAPRTSSANGGSTSPSSAGRPTRSASSSSTAARSRPTCRSRSSATRRRSTTGRGRRPRPRPSSTAAAIVPPLPTDAALLKLLGSPNFSSKRWVYEQYDSLILGNTVQGPGGDAAVIRLGDGPKGLALTTDCTERYCEADPLEGGKQAVAEAWRNLVAVGAKPLALTDNLNFGNPEKPHAMGQLVGCDRRHRRGRARARFPDRLGQRVALQRDDGRRASRRPRRSAASGSSPT